MQYLKAKQAILALSALGISTSMLSSCNKDSGVHSPIETPTKNEYQPVTFQQEKPELTDSSLEEYLERTIPDREALVQFRDDIVNQGLTNALNSRFSINYLRQAVITYIFEPRYKEEILSKINYLLDNFGYGLVDTEIDINGIDEVFYGFDNSGKIKSNYEYNRMSKVESRISTSSKLSPDGSKTNSISFCLIFHYEPEKPPQLPDPPPPPKK